MSGAPPSRTPLSAAARWAGFGAMCLGMFMAILDIQVVATSLPSIQAGLRAAPDAIVWVQTAYLTAEVVAIPLTGLLTRILGMRWLFILSVTLFTIASAGCAASDSLSALLSWRVLQGFSGGSLIPAVFSAVFLLFPERRQGVATTIAGVLAVLAPTAGPIVGGFITETWSWHWLFLVNILPGIAAALAGAAFLPAAPMNRAAARHLDLVALALLATALAAFEIGLKEAPRAGWSEPPSAGWMALSLVAATLFIRRSLKSREPVVDLRLLADRRLRAGSILSFTLGIGLFGSVYLMPVYLGFVRDMGALEIGEIMLVTGLVQLACAPAAVALERRTDARLLSAAGFALFAIGLGLSAFQGTEDGFAEMFWPQVVRGAAIMFCLLPPTRIALGHLPETAIPDASGLFNVMRNLGGAIGLSAIDTIIHGRAPVLAAALVDRLKAGDAAAARAVGIPLDLFLARSADSISPAEQALIAPMVERLALTQAINEAWALIAILTAAALLALPFAGGRTGQAR